ncbi:GLPGLI family protein [Empedobacter falsenii]|uniref:GLPGLI family protein n=1 Tax=Empedobacter falsenii TaxID=343874 RepID=A0AAW7DIN7_9FLAO|nr:GLPGLI family protein [Empedobacter falsenii]MDM1551828.1 GLPGLI family protein [Empedobacter falsenii]
MKKYTSLLMLFFGLMLFAQKNSLVEYYFINKLGVKDIMKEYLIFNENELYYANIQNDNNLNYEDEKLEKEIFNLEPLYTNLKTDSIYQEKIGIFDKNKSSYSRFILVEKIPTINWKIAKESQKILGYKCYKARAKFRGRDYIAWFTPDIPYNYGPWKLGGLPGLILKVESEFYDYEVKRIVLNSDKIPVLPRLKKFEEAEKKYTINQTIEYENNWLNYLLSNLIASLPPGSKIQEAPLRKDVRELSFEE